MKKAVSIGPKANEKESGVLLKKFRNKKVRLSRLSPRK